MLRRTCTWPIALACRSPGSWMSALLANGPMHDRQFSHREVFRIACREGALVCPGRGGNQAIALIQGHTASSEVAPPHARLPGSSAIDRQDNQPAEQSACCFGFVGAEAPHYLLDIDRRRRRHVTTSAQPDDASNRWSPPEEVDQHRRVKNPKHRSAGATRVGMALLPHPSRGVGIPLVILVLDSASCSLNIGPAKFLPNCTLDR